MMSYLRKAVFIGLVVSGIGAANAPAGAGQSELFAKGTIRLVPELTISDEAFAGKDFFGSIDSLAFDDRGAVYVCDAKAKNIKKFDASGKFLKLIGRAGQGPGEFTHPYEVEVFRDRLFVRDLFASRISQFDLEGTFLSAVSIDRKEGSWRRFQALPDGRWIVETEFVDRREPGAPQEMRLALHGPDFSFIKTIYRKPVFRNKYITEPVRTNVPLPFPARSKWGLTPDGKIVVGFSGSYEIEIHDPDKGKLLSWTQRFDPVAVTKKDRDDHFAGLVQSVGSSSGSVSVVNRGAPDYVVQNTEFPKTKPAFEDFAVDAAGNAWAFLWLPSPESKRLIDVFDPKGKLLGQVRLEGADRLTYVSAFRPGTLWMAITDDDGGTRIVKYRLSS